MKASLSLLSMGVLALLARSAHADPPAAAATAEPSARVVPTLSLSGTTTGTGKISAGLDVRTSSQDGGWDLHVAPSFTVATSNGVANVLSVSGDTGASGPPDWALGLTLSLVETDTAPWITPPGDAAALKAAAVCRARALSATATADEQAFWAVHAAKAIDQLPSAPPNVQAAVAAAAAAGPVNAAKALANLAGQCGITRGVVCAWLADVDTSLDEKQLCRRGQDLLAPGDRAMAERGRYPRTIWAFGGTYGATQFKDLTGPSTALALTTETHSNFVIGALFTHVSESPGTHFSAEVPVLFKSNYKAQTTTANWCVPAGTVTTTGGGTAAQSCNTQPLGSPQHQSQIWGAVLLGAAMEKGAVRFAMGPTFSYDAAASTPAPYQLGIQAPLYVRLAKNLAGYSGDYEGIVRLVPSFAVNHTATGLSPVGMVTLELLGKRGMFGSSLYWP